MLTLALDVQGAAKGEQRVAAKLRGDEPVQVLNLACQGHPPAVGPCDASAMLSPAPRPAPWAPPPPWRPQCWGVAPPSWHAEPCGNTQSHPISETADMPER